MMEDKRHFQLVFGYVVGVSICIMLYVIAVTFLPIPKDNIRFVDISFGFLLNIFGMAAAYLIGGNPSQTKKMDPDSGITLPPGEKTTVTTEGKAE